MWQSEKIWPACDFGWHSCWASCYIWKARLIISGHFLIFFAASIPVLRSYACPAWQVQDAAWPIQQTPTGLHPLALACQCAKIFNSTQRCLLQHHLPLTLVGSTGVGEVWIHWKRLQLRRFACLLHCSRGAPRHILWHGMFHTAFDRNIANSKAEFEVKPLQSRPKLALDTSTAKLRFNVNSLSTFCNLPCLSIQEEIETSKKTCWKKSPLVVEENGERSPSDKVNDLNGTSFSHSADIPPSWGRHQSPFW